jgi:hypothetical protein
MIKLGGLVSLKPINEAEYVHIGYGKYKEKGKEKDPNAQTFKKDDNDKFTPISSDKAAKGGVSSAGKDAPKVNIFDKPKEEPKSEPSKLSSKKVKDDLEDIKGTKSEKLMNSLLKGGSDPQTSLGLGDQQYDSLLKKLARIGGESEHEGKFRTNNYSTAELEKWAKERVELVNKGIKKSEPSQPKRQGNPEVNKKSLELSKEMGMTPQDFGNKKEYQDAMIGAAVSALTDANFHSEARELVAKVLGRPELAQKPDYPSLKDPDFDQKMAKIKDFYSAGDKYTKPSDEAQDFGIKIAQEAGWSGDDALDGIAFTLRQNGFKKLADTMQSVIKENKSTRLKDLV